MKIIEEDRANVVKFLNDINNIWGIFNAGECLSNDMLGRNFTEDETYSCLSTDFVIFWGATRLVLMPQNYLNEYVIKIPFETVKENYCDDEVEFYNEAVKCGVDKFFAEEAFVCDFYNSKIYLQSRAEVDYDCSCESMVNYYSSTLRDDDYPATIDVNNENECIEYCEELADEADYQDIPSLIYGIFRDSYSELDCNKLIDFIDEYGINDLHYANIGYNAQYIPQFIDYAGYNN